MVILSQELNIIYIKCTHNKKYIYLFRQTKINATDKQMAAKRNENFEFDKQIQHLNLIIAEQTAMRNIEREMHDAAEHKKR